VALVLFTGGLMFGVHKIAKRLRPLAPNPPNLPVANCEALTRVETALGKLTGEQEKLAASLSAFSKTNGATVIYATNGEVPLTWPPEERAALTGMEITLKNLDASLSNQQSQLLEIKKKFDDKKTSLVDGCAILRDVVTTIGIIIGGVWAYKRFKYDARAHIASLDGELTVESSNLRNNQLIAVSIRAVWNNKGKFPVELNPQGCFVFVFQVPDDRNPGLLSFGESGYLYKEPFNSGEEGFTLEANTESVLRMHFVLKRNAVYMFRWQLETKPSVSPPDKSGVWKKEIIWKADNGQKLVTLPKSPGHTE
jgi:hypothetical protein